MQRKTAKCLVSGLLAAALLMWGTPALAQGEDGGSVSASPADQVFPTGISVNFSRDNALVLDMGDT